MKKLSTILQLPIMEILNGKKVGQTKDIILNLDTKDIAYVLDDSIVASLYVIKGEEIQGIGRDVILIKTSQSIQNSQENKELSQELGDYYSVIGLDVISMEGNIEGTITDLSVDEKQEKIIEIELENGQTFGADKIISISDKYVFVQEGSGGSGTPEAAADEVQDIQSIEQEAVQNDLLEETQEEEADSIQNVEQEEAEVPAEGDESSYLVGMVLGEDVANEDGAFIVKKGTVLTKELINEAREYGVFANLIMNAE